MSSEQKELTINQHLDALDTALEDGPADNVSAAQFLRETLNDARALVGALETLTEQDVDEIWPEGDEENGEDEG